MKIPIVDENDNLLCFKDTNEWDRAKEITRASTLWIFDEEKNILIARRSSKHDFFPNVWGPSTSGLLEEGYTHEENIIKETNEEIGINLTNFNLGPKVKDSDNLIYFMQYFFGKIQKDTKFVLQEEEVGEVRWIKINELKEWFVQKPEEFLPTFGESLRVAENYLNKNEIKS